MAVTREQVLEALGRVQDPSGGDIVGKGIVRALTVEDGAVRFVLEIDGSQAKAMEPVRAQAQAAVEALAGVQSVSALMTAHSQQKAPPELTPRKAAPQGPQKIPGVAHIIAIASGKGGVGKSTTAANLALGFQANGLKVGILDADIYGPSMPRLLRISGRPQNVSGRILKPMEGYGLKVMSMGFLVDEETPMIWRGPMVISALTQMLREVEWGELDVLVVDMPPGTGDAQLTMAQNVPLAGAVIVSTPQDLALIDARKGLSMFRKVDVPILGIVENMSYFICPDCGGRHDIFGHGGARKEAERIGVPFLGEVPLDMAIRETSDGGTPVVVSAPDSPHAKVYRDIARQAWERVEAERQTDKSPAIVFE